MFSKTRNVFQEAIVIFFVMVICTFTLARPAYAIDISVHKIPISNLDVELNAEEFSYTGQPITPKVTVSAGRVELIPYSDFIVMYYHNTNVGTGYAKVYGKGFFGGWALIPFEIKPSGLSVAEFASSDEFVGLPYVYGGTSKDGFDCSGFCQYIYRQFGYELPRTADEQMYEGDRIRSLDDLQPGDLVVFYAGGHVGIDIGDGKFVHAANKSKGLIISSFYDDEMSGDHYAHNFTSGARII